MPPFWNSIFLCENKLKDIRIGNLTIDSKVVYQHALIYFSLQSKITKSMNESYYKMRLSSSSDSYYCRKGSSTIYNIGDHTEGPGYNKSYHYRAYSGVKRCTEFIFNVSFRVFREQPYEEEEWTLRINCGAN